MTSWFPPSYDPKKYIAVSSRLRAQSLDDFGVRPWSPNMRIVGMELSSSILDSSSKNSDRVELTQLWLSVHFGEPYLYRRLEPLVLLWFLAIGGFSSPFMSLIERDNRSSSWLGGSGLKGLVQDNGVETIRNRNSWG
ncbi:hypothetical protein SLA2020_012970 [Shorea laevis]